MDVLSDILDSVEMEASLYFVTDFQAPWGFEVPRDTNVCRFHAVTFGHCWIEVPDADVGAVLSQGDLVLVPHGARHLLRDSLESAILDLDEALEGVGYPGTGVFRWGRGGVTARLVCGHFAFDRDAVHPLLSSLPALIHLQATPSRDFGWMEQIVRFIGHEASSSPPGSDRIASRLSEILFIQALRHYVEHSEGAVPLLSGIADPQIGRALRAMHREPAEAWTLDSLAGQANMSRTAFAQRFSALVGTTPIRYLTDLRMRRARELLKEPITAAAVAERVGYGSEAAFHRRFKETYGMGPGAYRRALARQPATDRQRRRRRSGPSPGVLETRGREAPGPS